MAGVVLDRVAKRYGRSGPATVRDLTLTVNDHELLVLVGPSGCGKSTVLRMIAGLEDITGGSLFIGDKRVNDVAPKDRDVAMVFQSYALYPHMTCFENMAFALKLRGLPKRDIHERVIAAARSLAIEPLLERRPKQLSGGQRQRVAIGRAIVREPSVFLMDEPLSNLDAKLRVGMRAEIRRVHDSLAATIVYVTHDQTEAMTLGDRIAVLRAGELVQVGTPEDIHDRPATAFVATFMGSPEMNLLPAELSPEGLRGDGFQLDVHGEGPREVLLGIRPENVSLANGDGQLHGAVSLVESTGSEAWVHVDTPAGRVIARATTRPRTGEHVGLAFDTQRVHLFDRASEARIS